jgi:MOSC domain-containing protein YiiM
VTGLISGPFVYSELGYRKLLLGLRTFRFGKAALEYTGLWHPCSRMEQTLGIGGYNAMRSHGGIPARVTRPGRIYIGEQCLIAEQD